MQAPADLDALLQVRVPYADYVAARGRSARIEILDASDVHGLGTLREVGSAGPVGPGLECFWLGFAIVDAAPAQGLYRIEIEGLPVHALLLVPSARQGGTTEYHASINRMSA